MLNPESFKSLISGRQTGVPASLLRWFLGLVEPAYCFAVRWRNRRYDSHKAKIYRVEAKTISVGNITLGGTGKTPMVEWLARWFCKRNVRVGLVSRGYQAVASEANDEALELRLSLPEVPHIQNPDRVSAAKMLIERHNSQVIVLDDAFQHRRIHRDLDIVLLDAMEPFGHGHVFPRGLLREPLEGLARADVVVLSRADMIEPRQREEIWQKIRKYAKNAIEVEAAHVPQYLISVDGRKTTLDSIKTQKIAAFCGIGNPEGFRRTIESCGLQLTDLKTFTDHHHYTQADLRMLTNWATKLQATTLLCTRKDIVKLGVSDLGGIPLRAVVVELDFINGREKLEAALATLI